MKNSDRMGLPYGAQVPVLPVRNNLRRPNSSHFSHASRFQFRKGLASKCSWKCTAIVFIILSVVLTAALSYVSGNNYLNSSKHQMHNCDFPFPASNFLNWSYQNSKACTVLVGENSEVFPASKTTSETNLSTSSRPRPSPSGGNYIDGVYTRKRRHVNNTSHAFVLSNVATNSPVSSVLSTTEHVVNVSTTSAPLLHEVTVDNDGFLLKKDNFNASVTNSTGDSINSTTGEPATSTASVVTDQTSTELNTETSEVSEISQSTDLSMTTEYASSSTSVLSQEKKSEADAVTEKTSLQTEDVGVIKIEKDDFVEIPEETVENKTAKKPESISMKPSEGEGPEVIQHDYPVYAYGQEDEVEIVKLNHETLSTTMKSKTSYNKDKVDIKLSPHLSEKEKESSVFEGLTNHSLSATEYAIIDDNKHKSDVHNGAILNKHESVEFINATNPIESTVSETNKQSKISIIEVPPLPNEVSNPSKRILVNVTIATEPDSKNPYASQSVYVLSVSVPTNGNPSEVPDVSLNSHNSSIPNKHHLNDHTSISTEKPNDYVWGGGDCQCSCPCLDDDKLNLTDIFSQEYDDYDMDNYTFRHENISFPPSFYLTNVTESQTTESVMEMSSTEATTEPEESWKTESRCPEITTQVPPTPTILILEGRNNKGC